MRWKAPIVYFVICEGLYLIYEGGLADHTMMTAGMISALLLIIITFPGNWVGGIAKDVTASILGFTPINGIDYNSFWPRFASAQAPIIFCTLLIITLCLLPDLLKKIDHIKFSKHIYTSQIKEISVVHSFIFGCFLIFSIYLFRSERYLIAMLLHGNNTTLNLIGFLSLLSGGLSITASLCTLFYRSWVKYLFLLLSATLFLRATLNSWSIYSGMNFVQLIFGLVINYLSTLFALASYIYLRHQTKQTIPNKGVQVDAAVPRG